MVDAVLRVFDEDRAEKTTILNKVNTLLDDIKKTAAEPSSDTKKTDEENGDDEAITKVIKIDEKAVKEDITDPKAMKANRRIEPVGLLDIGSNTIKAFYL
jgi:hypothetical protein